MERKKEGHAISIIPTGDYFETYSPSERVKLAAANFHETTVEAIDKFTQMQADCVVEDFWPLRGSIEGVLSGHHWKPIKVNGVVMSTDQYIAEKLGAVYAGDGIGAHFYLVNGLPLKVVAMHGYGAARTAGARVNKRLQMREVICNANIYFMGHDNEKMAIPRDPFQITDSGELKILRQFFCAIGSHQRGYIINKLEAGYVERLALPPAVVGAVRATVEVVKGEDKKPELKIECTV